MKFVKYCIFLMFASFASAQFVPGPSSGGGTATVLSRVGSPGNTVGPYQSQCQTTGATPVLYLCKNASGCTVAADWFSSAGTGTFSPGGSQANGTLLEATSGSAYAWLATANGGLVNTNPSGVPSVTPTPVLGVASTTTGTLGIQNASNAFTFTLASAAGMTASNTLTGPVAVPTNGHILDCTTTSTTCVLTDAGIAAANLVVATSPAAGIAHFAGSTQSVTSSPVSLTADVSGILPGANGGTGVANTGFTMTMAGNVAFTGAFNPTFAIPATGTWTFPAAGTLVNTGVTTLSSLASVGTIGTGTWQGTIVGGTYGGTGVNNGAHTITLAGNLVTTGAFNTTFAQAATTTVTLPSTNSTMARTDAGQTFTGTQTFSTPIAAGSGGTGVSNTATLTLGTSNQNWATIGTGIVKVTTTTGAISDAASSDVYGLWSGTCSSSTFLRGDGTCAAPTGSGTVTVVGAGSLTSTAIVTGGGSQTIQTPSATATMDTSGNIVTPGGITTGSGGSVGGYYAFGQGTATTAPTSSVGFMAPTSVTTKFMMTLPAAPVTGFILSTGTVDPTVLSFVASNGSGNVLLSAGTAAIASGKTLTVSNSLTLAGTDSTTMTFPTTSQTIPGMNQANTGGASMTWNLIASTGADSLRVPYIAGATAGATGSLTEDSTNKNYHIYANGADSIIAPFAATGLPTNGDCVQSTVNASNYLLSDAGAKCVTGTAYQTVLSGGTSITQRSTINFISGSNATASCVDNSGANRTDCTISASSSAGSRLDQISAATGTNTIQSGDNAQIWQWLLTTSGKSAYTFTEPSASSAAGTPWLININTISSSTVNPLIVTAQGTANGVAVLKTGFLTSEGTGGINSNMLFCDVTTSSKCIQNVLSGITASNTRTVTWPDASITVARTDAAQTFTGIQTFSTPIALSSLASTVVNATSPGIGIAHFAGSTQTVTSSLIVGADVAASLALTGTPTSPTATAGDNTTQIATDAFVTTAVANAVAGVNPAVAVLAASTANLTGTYVQVGGGIGDTFTITATGAFSLDGVAITATGTRVLFKNQSTASQNGVYTATVAGTTGISAVFTRALDYDTPSDVNNTGAIPVQSGTANASTSWLLTSQVTSIGSAGSSLTYSQFTYAPSTLVTGTSANQTLGTPVAGGIGYGVSTTQIGTTAALTQYGVVFSGGTGAPTSSAQGASNTILMGQGASNPVFSTATYPATTTVNQLLYSSSASVIGGLATANNAVLVTSSGGVPSLAAPTSPLTVSGSALSISANGIANAQLAVVQTRRTCVIDNDTQSATALVAAQFSGHCVIPAAATIVEVDVTGGTQTLTGTATAPTFSGTSSIQIGKIGTSGSTGLLSAALATVSGRACALTSTSGTCILTNGSGTGVTSSGSVSISTTALTAGDVLYVSAGSPDTAQTWYNVCIIYTIN